MNKDMKPSVVTEGDCLILYPDTRKAVRRLNQRFVFLMLPMVVCYWVAIGALQGALLRHQPPRPSSAAPSAPSSVSHVLNLDAWLLTTFCVVLYACVMISLRRQRRPIVTLSPEGIAVHALMTQIGLIRWDEVQEIRPYNLIYRLVGIVPLDMSILCRRAGFGRSLIIRMNAWVVPLYQMFGIFVAPINIAQEYLPISADELMGRIQQFRASLPQSRPPAGDWPPPPMAH